MAILINDTAPRAQYTATSGQTVFTVPFEFFVNSDLKVYRNSTLLTLTTNYTVTGAGVTGGGSVTFVTGATAGDIVTIVRDVPVSRTSDFPTSGPFNIEALNTDLDRLTAMVQQQETLDGRSLRLDQFDTPNTLNVLPVKASRIGRVLQFNASTGQPEAGPTTSEIANAQTYATNASTSATAAAASAATASSAATSASGSASSATSSASAASTSASNASTSASNASTSASNASTSATNAANSATAAAGSASTASTQATNAASSASAASTSATNAASSASSASAAQTAAESARDATLAAYDSFDDRYLGTKTSNPTLDNDGNALVAGALYFNSVAGEMRLYTGSAWVAAYVSGAGFLALSGGTMTGPVQFAAGSVSAPGITASGDTNTGIFFPAADTIAFAEGGVEAMRIDSSANIGIGTNAPGFKVDITGTIRSTGEARFDNAINLKTATLNQFYFDDALAFTRNGVGEFMRFSSGGAVGIGTNAPASAKLVVSGNSVGNSNIRLINTAVGGRTWDICPFAVGVTDATFAIRDGTAAADRLAIDSSGNIGIGTSSPSASLSIAKQTTALSGTGNSYGVYVYPTSSGLSYIDAITGSTGNTSLGLRTYNNGTYNEIRVGPSGQLGIGGANYGTAGQALVSNGSGAAPSWQAPIPDMYTGTSGTNTTFPVGSYLLGESQPDNLASTITLYVQTSAAGSAVMRTSSVGRTALTGTWRARGSGAGTAEVGSLWQRTA